MATTDTSTSSKSETGQGIFRWAVQMITGLIVFGTIMFLTAGRMNWISGLGLSGDECPDPGTERGCVDPPPTGHAGRAVAGARRYQKLGQVLRTSHRYRWYAGGPDYGRSGHPFRMERIADEGTLVVWAGIGVCQSNVRHMGDGQQSVFRDHSANPGRPRSHCYHPWTVSTYPSPRLCRLADLQPCRSAGTWFVVDIYPGCGHHRTHYHSDQVGRSNTSERAAWLYRICRQSTVPADTWGMVVRSVIEENSVIP